MVNCIVIDDNQNILDLFCDFLDLLKIDVLATGINGKEAAELYEEHTPDIVLQIFQCQTMMDCML